MPIHPSVKNRGRSKQGSSGRIPVQFLPLARAVPSSSASSLYQHHQKLKFQLDDYGKDFMNRCDVSVYIVPFDSLILTFWFFILKRYP